VKTFPDDLRELDPPGVALAHDLDALCEAIELPLFPKTSGQQGLHLLIPLGRQCTHEQAKSLGVMATIDPTQANVIEDILERTKGLGVDATIECSGNQAALDAAVGATRPAGTIAQIAIHVGPRTVVPEAWTWKDLTIAGIWSFKYYDTPRILRQIASGKLPVERIVTSKINVVDVVSRGIDGLADPMGNQVKILVSPRAN